MSNYEDDQSEDGELARSPMQDELDFRYSFSYILFFSRNRCFYWLFNSRTLINILHNHKDCNIIFRKRKMTLFHSFIYPCFFLIICVNYHGFMIIDSSIILCSVVGDNDLKYKFLRNLKSIEVMCVEQHSNRSR